jgi:serine/threonine protein kinase
MAHVSGGSLANRLKKQGLFVDVREAARLAQMAAEGLHALHSAGVIHRDLKPGNILLDSEGRPLLTDFGLARLSESAGLTRDNALLGTPAYMAPEQADGGTATAREPADVYSLGATFYQMVTGEVPFPGEPIQVLRQLGRVAPPTPSSVRSDLDPGLEAILNQMMARRPEDRPSAAAVAGLLGRWLESAGNGDSLTSTVSESRQATCQTQTRHPPKQTWSAKRGHGPRLVLALIALGVSLVLMSALFQSSFFKKSNDPLTSGTPTSVLQPRIRDLSIKLLAHVDGKPVQALGLVGKDCYQAHWGDSVTLEANLSEPAYAYIVAFRPDGTDDICFPEKEDEVPQPTHRPRYPSDSQQFEYGLDEGEGLQVFAVVVSSQPLPGFKEWKDSLGKSPWGHFEATSGIVWRGDNEGLDALTAIPGDNRGKGHEIPGKTQVSKLIAWLRQDPKVEDVLAVGFPVLPTRNR